MTVTKTPAYLVIRDGARQVYPEPSAHQAKVADIKRCLTCRHWTQLHPGHGPCVAYRYVYWAQTEPCPCTGFADPEPGRPDQVYTRDQIERMWRYRFEAIKDRLYLMKDGRYAKWDQWCDPERYFAGSGYRLPGDPEPPQPPSEAATAPLEPPAPPVTCPGFSPLTEAAKALCVEVGTEDQLPAWNLLARMDQDLLLVQPGGNQDVTSFVSQ
jgi:hypothetical protein